MPGAPNSLRPFLGVVLLNALLTYPLLFLVYKHFDDQLTPMDIPAYMAMVEAGPSSVEPPYRYRFLPTVVVRAMRSLPAYDIPVAFSGDAAAQEDFFHFILLNSALTLAVSGLVFLWLRPKAGAGPAYLGSLLYLFSFYGILTNLIPMTDAACHLAIMGAILLMERNRPVGFALACLAGAFTKETLFIVLIGWILIQSLSDRRRLRYLAYCLPGLLAYAAAVVLMPGESQSPYYKPGYLIGNLFAAFRPGAYDRHMIFQIFLAHLPLLAALAAFLWLKAAGRARDLFLNRELILFPFLVWLGITMGIGNNSGRVAFMAFPALIEFVVMVAVTLAREVFVAGAAGEPETSPRRGA